MILVLKCEFFISETQPQVDTFKIHFDLFHKTRLSGNLKLHILLSFEF